MVFRSKMELDIKMNDIKRKISSFKEFDEKYIVSEEERRKWSTLLIKNVSFDLNISIAKEYQDVIDSYDLPRKNRAIIRKYFVDQIKKVFYFIVVRL